MAVVYYLLLGMMLLVGLILNAFTLPGLWVMVLAAALYGLLTAWAYLSLKMVLILAGIALAGEIIELFASSAGAKRAGASRRGLIGATVGGVVGGIFLSLPLWIIGTLAGILIGTFLGALIAELTKGQRIDRSVWIGVGATLGRLLGTLIKISIGCVMMALTLYEGWPHRARVALPASRPAATLPATTRGG